MQLAPGGQSREEVGRICLGHALNNVLGWNLLFSRTKFAELVSNTMFTFQLRIRLRKFGPIKSVSEHPCVIFVRMDMCRYSEAYKKPTCLLNCPGLADLARNCNHSRHEIVLACKMKTQQIDGTFKTVPRTILAGRYPDAL